MPVRLLQGPRSRVNSAFYVILEQTEGGIWQAAKMTTRAPAGDLTQPQRAQGAHGLRPMRGSSEGVRVRYVIESYFVPEGRGRKLEAQARESRLATLLAVDSEGNAAIKGLVVDGALQCEEPLF